MISNNYIPEKINDANAYLDGTRMIGVAASVDLPEINMKTGTVEGFGIGGEVDSPTIGQWESFEQAVQFNTLYSSAVDSTFYCGRRTVCPRAVRLIISSVWRRAAPWTGLWWAGFHFRPTRSRSRT